MRYKSHKVSTQDYKHAQSLRSNSSLYERKLWKALRNNQTAAKLKFRRQQPIHPYVADFACMQAKLIVEIDGLSHDISCSYDKRRDNYLQKMGFTVLRFKNDDVRDNVDAVVATIIYKAWLLLRIESPLS